MVKKIFFIFFLFEPLIGMEKPTSKRPIQAISTVVALTKYVSKAKKPKCNNNAFKRGSPHAVDDENCDVRSIIDADIPQDFAEFLHDSENEDLNTQIEQGFDDFLQQQKNYEEKRQEKVLDGTKKVLSYKCDQCDKLYKSKQNLLHHINTFHEKRRSRCIHVDCDKSYTTKSKLQEHIRIIHEKRRFMCDQCDKNYTRKVVLQAHIKAIHEKIKFNCDQCDKHFTTKRGLQYHIKAKHKIV